VRWKHSFGPLLVSPGQYTRPGASTGEPPTLCHLDQRNHGPKARPSAYPKVMKSGFCSATTLNGSAALPFVISTGAPKERSGEICGFSGLFLEMFLDRSVPGFPASRCWRRPRVRLSVKRAACRPSKPGERSGEICVEKLSWSAASPRSRNCSPGVSISHPGGG
jgi:hypothetical protein